MERSWTLLQRSWDALRGSFRKRVREPGSKTEPRGDFSFFAGSTPPSREAPTPRLQSRPSRHKTVLANLRPTSPLVLYFTDRRGLRPPPAAPQIASRNWVCFPHWRPSGRNTAPRGPKTVPKGVQEALRRLQERSKRPQDDPKSAPGGFKTAPRVLKVPPRGLKTATKRLQDGSGGLKMAPRASETAPRGPQIQEKEKCSFAGVGEG